MKIIIYALGKMFEHYRERLNWDQIIALTDKNKKAFCEIHGVPVILPDTICKLDYDYIAIFSDEYFSEIKMELVGEYFVPQDKIISWKELIAGEKVSVAAVLPFYQNFLKRSRCKKILDFGMSMIARNCLIKEELISEKENVLDGIWSTGAIRNDNLYDHIYKKYEDCMEQYDAVLLCEECLHSDMEWKRLIQHTRYMLMYTRYLQNGMAIKKTLETKLQQYGRIKCISGPECLFWIIDTDKSILLNDILVYVVVHRNYNLQLNSFYKPLCVGYYQKEGYLTEQTGDNISYLNSKINECTALYWIWKNTNTKYVGLNHYRRYFYMDEIKNMDNYLDAKYASEILKEYDIILPKTYPLEKKTVLKQIQDSINKELCDKAYILFRRKLKEKQPEYLQAFDSVMEGYNAFLCNMFVTRREILNRYCEWLFSFLIEIAEEVDVRGYDNYSQRVIGFFAERMWTVWLRRNRLKIKELPYVIIK